MKIVKWIVIIITTIFLLAIIFIPKEEYYTQSSGNPYIGGNPDCLGILIPLGCSQTTCDNLCIGKVLYYGAIAPLKIK